MSANDLLFQYFFVIGAGLSSGVLTVIALGYLAYRVLTRKKRLKGVGQDV
ncbi:hypothetical protein [Rhodococcus rhodochrous]|nr:hypothetical protein [Rhodococcus rhodochrous]